MLALLLRGGRAPSFVAEETPRQQDEMNVTPQGQLEETTRIVNAFCEKHTALRVVPTEAELILFWTQCSSQPTAALTAVLSERLLCTVAEDDRHTQVRLLHALGHFFDTGNGARKVANLVMDETNELVEHLATEVSDSREVASNLLKQWHHDGGFASVDCPVSPNSASSTDLAPTESEGQETLTQTDQSEAQDWGFTHTTEGAAVPKAAGPVVALPPPRASSHTILASSPGRGSVPSLNVGAMRPASPCAPVVERSQSAQSALRPKQAVQNTSVEVSWPMALDGIQFTTAAADPPREPRNVPKSEPRPLQWRSNLGPKVPLAEEVEIWRAPDPFARFNPLDGCPRSVHMWEDDGGFSNSRSQTL